MEVMKAPAPVPPFILKMCQNSKYFYKNILLQFHPETPRLLCSLLSTYNRVYVYRNIFNIKMIMNSELIHNIHVFLFLCLIKGRFFYLALSNQVIFQFSCLLQLPCIYCSSPVYIATSLYILQLPCIY